MKKRDLDVQQIVHDAKTIFADSDSYTDKQIFNYYRFLCKIVGFDDFNKNSLSIEALENDLKILKPNQIKIIRLRFFENCTLEEISKLYSVTDENVRQTQNRAIDTLRAYAKNFSFAKCEKISDTASNLIKEINSKIDFETDFQIKDLSFIQRKTANILSYCDIEYVSQLLEIANDDLRKLYKFDLMCKEIEEVFELFSKDKFIEKKIRLHQAILSGIKFKNDFGLSTLNLNPKIYNALHRKSIFFTSQFLTLTEIELKSMHNIGTKSIEKILEIQTKLWEGEIL